MKLRPPLGQSLPIRLAAILIVAMVVAGEPTWNPPGRLLAADTIKTEEVSGNDAKPANGTKITERQKKAYIGLAALAGIIIAGLSVGALTMVWAGRLRRQLRKPMPGCAVSERDFWFLKPPKQLVTKSSLPEAHMPPHVTPPEESDGK